MKVGIIKSTIRYKKIKGKRIPLCDYKGICKNKAYMEVYLFLLKGKYKKRGWNYLCKKHFEQENKRFKGKLPSCYVD